MPSFTLRLQTFAQLTSLFLLIGCNELKEITMDLSILKSEGVQKNPVGILHNGRNFCGATLLENGNIVTAGHCVTRSMAVRFQNPDGTFKIVEIKKTLRKYTATFDQFVNPPTPLNIVKSKDYALLEVEDPKTLQDEFSFFKLVEETEYKNTYDATSPTYHYAEGNFFLYDISGKTHTLRKQKGDLSFRDAYTEKFYELFQSLIVARTKLVSQQSGSPYVYNNKLYGVATLKLASSHNEVLSGDFTAGVITQSLVIR